MQTWPASLPHALLDCVTLDAGNDFFSDAEVPMCLGFEGQNSAVLYSCDGLTKQGGLTGYDSSARDLFVCTYVTWCWCTATLESSVPSLHLMPGACALVLPGRKRCRAGSDHQAPAGRWRDCALGRAPRAAHATPSACPIPTPRVRQHGRDS